MKYILSIIFVLFLSVVIFAQDNDCPVLERNAVTQSWASCAELAIGEACYGNSSLSAELLSDDLSFSESGDRVALDSLATLSSSKEDKQYGVALLRTSGYAIDSWISQDVVLALLGDVTIANTGNENINVPVVTAPIVGSQGANVRSGTSTDYRLITTLFEGEIVKITGRLADDSYYRIQLPSGEIGWIAAGAVEEDVSNLPIVDLDSVTPEILYAPYSSFSLETAFADAQCRESWESGLLVQAPKDSIVRLRINDTEILLNGTIFVQSRPTVDNRIFVIEGSVKVGETIAEEGYWLLIAIDGIDPLMETYELSRLAYLPTEILPRYVYIGIDLSTIITPAPSQDRSPIADVLVTSPCVLTTGQGGANLRSGPGNEFPIRGVLAFRETANPIGRINGTDGTNWWELAQNLWVNGSVVVTGGDCFSVPESQRIPIPTPTATPEN